MIATTIVFLSAAVEGFFAEDFMFANEPPHGGAESRLLQGGYDVDADNPNPTQFPYGFESPPAADPLVTPESSVWDHVKQITGKEEMENKFLFEDSNEKAIRASVYVNQNRLSQQLVQLTTWLQYAFPRVKYLNDVDRDVTEELIKENTTKVGNLIKENTTLEAAAVMENTTLEAAAVMENTTLGVAAVKENTTLEAAAVMENTTAGATSDLVATQQSFTNMQSAMGLVQLALTNALNGLPNQIQTALTAAFTDAGF